MNYSLSMNVMKDFTDPAAAFTGDIRHGFISLSVGNNVKREERIKKLYFCKECRYIFPSPAIPGRCPDCGAKHVRKASAREMEEYRWFQEIIREEIRLGVISG